MDLKEVSKKDKYWRAVALNICKDKSLADDLVQDMYLKVNEIDKEINDFYIITIINNLFIDVCRKNKNELDVSELYNLVDTVYNYEFNDRDVTVLERANKLTWFQTKLLSENYDKSIRQIESEYNINYGFIYRELLKARKLVLADDFDKLYKNKRFKNCRVKK